MNGEVVLTDDIATTFARIVITAFEARNRARFSIALSGGVTASSCYEQLGLVDVPEFWEALDLYWGDERCVPLEDPDSNFQLASKAFGQRFDELQSVNPMVCDRDGADSYDALLRSLPPIDLVHLGLGPDGHTASLFPGSTALSAEPGVLVCSNLDPTGRNPHPRMTLTYAGIRRSLLVVVTVEGAGKHEALTRVFEGDPTAPASGVDAENLIWIVDSGALGTPRHR
jgi:6-phosphogluconolactonase